MKLSLKVKTGYGITGIADQCLYFMYGTFFLFFLTNVVGLNASVAGFIAALGAIWDALMAPVMGFLSDATHTKWGKRKPFIIGIALPMAIMLTLLFTAIDASMPVKIVYYAVMTLMFWTGFPVFFIPFLAWGAELTEDYNERTQLRSFAYVGNTVGMAIGTVFPTIMVDYLMNMGKTLQDAWQGAAMIVSVCVVLSLVMGPLMIKDQSNLLGKKAKDKLNVSPFGILHIMINNVKVFVIMLKLKPLMFIILASITYLAANTIFVADRLYYYTFNMKLSTGAITALMAIGTFTGMIFIPVLALTSKKFDKRAQYLIGMTICAVCMLALRFIGVTNFLEATIMLIAFGLGSICYWQLMPAMIYDVCELDEIVSGQQRQGTIVSLQALSESASEAIGLFLLGNMLEFAGFNGEAVVQSQSALFWVDNAFTFIPAIFMFISIVMVYKYPITRNKFNEIFAMLQKKRAGEKVDLSEFDDIL